MLPYKSFQKIFDPFRIVFQNLGFAWIDSARQWARGQVSCFTFSARAIDWCTKWFVNIFRLFQQTSNHTKLLPDLFRTSCHITRFWAAALKFRFGIPVLPGNRLPDLSVFSTTKVIPRWEDGRAKRVSLLFSYTALECKQLHCKLILPNLYLKLEIITVEIASTYFRNN